MDDFKRIRRRLEGHRYAVDGGAADLAGLQQFLDEKRVGFSCGSRRTRPSSSTTRSPTFCMRSPPARELMLRDDLTALSEADRAHLAGDFSRAYRHLALEWLGYLQTTYPYLFSLAVLRNSFGDRASPGESGDRQMRRGARIATGFLPAFSPDSPGGSRSIGP